MTPALKARLDAAADAGGRSQSQEAEFRLERSFDRSDLLSEALSLSYGKELAGVLLMVGEAMAFAGSPIDETYGTVTARWAPDAKMYDRATWAAWRVLTTLRPKGSREFYSRVLGELIAQRVIDSVQGKSDHYARGAPIIRSLLGPLTPRLTKETMEPGADPFALAFNVQLASAALGDLEKEYKDRGGANMPEQELVRMYEDAVSTLDYYLGAYLVPDWQHRRQGGEGEHHTPGQEELAPQIRHRRRSGNK